MRAACSPAVVLVLTCLAWPGFGAAEVTEAEANDCNIWQEPEGDLYLVYMEDDKKQIKAATLNKLVVKMTSDTDFGTTFDRRCQCRQCRCCCANRCGSLCLADQSFVDMLLMTYKSFTTPDKMLTKIIQRFQAPSSADAKAVSLSTLFARLARPALDAAAPTYDDDRCRLCCSPNARGPGAEALVDALHCRL